MVGSESQEDRPSKRSPRTVRRLQLGGHDIQRAARAQAQRHASPSFQLADVAERSSGHVEVAIVRKRQELQVVRAFLDVLDPAKEGVAAIENGFRLDEPAVRDVPALVLIPSIDG